MSKERVAQFRSEITFSRNDAKLIRDRHRYVLALNLKDRTDRVLRAVLSKGASGIGIADIAEVMNAKAKHPYSQSDVSTCLRKLKGLGLVVRRGTGKNAIWRATKDAAALWRKTKIIKK